MALVRFRPMETLREMNPQFPTPIEELSHVKIE